MPSVIQSSAQLRDRALHCLSELPPFSPVLNQLLADLGKEDTSYSKLADLIERDTVVAGSVLRLVNSALYGRRGTVNSVRNAIAVLGLNKLRNVALGLSVTRMMSMVQTANQFSVARFNQHSVATGVLADMVAQVVPVQYPEGAFVAGLFHDLGKMLIAIGLREEYRTILKLYSKGDRPLHLCEQEVLGFDHAELSWSAINSWNLPEPIQLAVHLHHSAKTDPTGEPGVPALSFVLSAANRFVKQCGIGVEEKISEVDLTDGTSLEDILDERYNALVEEFQIEFRAIAQVFSS